eukprot:GHVN01055972.1.p1 GENE.GHVN01055972.1~~GHVN01055972.1.p1  ORF type:complete len:566 (-),score=89.05 GHVN01055972.1:159-1856(-)
MGGKCGGAFILGATLLLVTHFSHRTFGTDPLLSSVSIPSQAGIVSRLTSFIFSVSSGSSQGAGPWINKRRATSPKSPSSQTVNGRQQQNSVMSLAVESKEVVGEVSQLSEARVGNPVKTGRVRDGSEIVGKKSKILEIEAQYLPKRSLAMTDQEKMDVRRERQSFASKRTRFPTPENDSLLRTLLGEQVDSTPVWIMRQAGRYLPEFRYIRRMHDFVAICRDPALSAEVTLQPMRRFPLLDAMIVFSDILVIPRAMGVEFGLSDISGIQFEWNFGSPFAVDSPEGATASSYTSKVESAAINIEENIFPKLNFKPDVEETLGFVFDAIYYTKKLMSQGPKATGSTSASVPLFGFCGAPLTIMEFMVGEKSEDGARPFFQWLIEFPTQSHRLLEAITDLTSQYLIGQYDAGADVLQVFDTKASGLPRNLYERFGVPYVRKLAENVKTARPDAPMIAFPKSHPTRSLFETESHLRYDGISIDSLNSPQEVRELVGPGVTIQGNLDPYVMYLSPQAIEGEALKMVQDARSSPSDRYIANLGHGMQPGMEVKAVEAFIKGVKRNEEQQMM